MLSRLSSFSGPFSKIFKPGGSFTLDGLILRYEFSNKNSYSGTNTAIDLVSNSNATLTNGPTFSANGYLNLDGTNDYLITNTSLDSVFAGSFPNKSEVTSIFLWIYPKDNGVLVTELGVGNISSGWHATNIEMTSSGLRFGVWGGLSVGYVTSAIPVSLRKWYYVGLTYDGSKITAWVNGQNAGQANFDRSAPYNSGGNGLFYALGLADITNMGDGTYANFKLGAFHVYKIAMSSQQVLNNYNAQKSNYIYTEDMLIWIDANDPESFTGGSIFDISGNNYTHSFADGATFSTVDGIKCFDCTTGNKRIVVDGTGPLLPTTGYTYVVWAKVLSDDTSFRTLLYTKSPRYTPITIPDNTNTLGYWDSDFRSSGYDITSFVGEWTQYAVVGDDSSQKFYINGSQVGSSISYGSGGNLHDGLGNNLGVSQPFGHVANMILYGKKLTQEEIKQNYDALKHLYNPQIVTDGLLLRLDANNSNSYSGSGTIWYDIAGTQQNMTLINSPTFVSGTVSYFDFNGTNQYATGTGLTVGTSSYTKSVWFWVDVYTDNNIVSGFDGVGGHFLYMSGTTKVIVGHHNQPVSFGTYQSTGSISLNNWYNVTVTFDTITGFKIYINGQLDSTHSMTLAHLGSGTTNLAAYSNSGGNYFNGRISKVYTYSRVLDDNEVLQNFNADRLTFGI